MQSKLAETGKMRRKVAGAIGKTVMQCSND